MDFFRVIEVFPPLLAAGSQHPDEFLDAVESIRKFSDLILVASLKSQPEARVAPVQAAIAVQDTLKMDAAPVIVARGSSRARLRSTLMTCITEGLESVALMWGDSDRPVGAEKANDFHSLSEVITEAYQTASDAGRRLKVLAPVDLATLGTERGLRIAMSRVKAGAGPLLAQPPTTDPAETYRRHTGLIESSGLGSHVLLGVFPFRGREDVVACEKQFGWSLPRALHEASAGGRSRLLEVEREVVRRVRDEGGPGVYVSTRGDPAVAGSIIG